MKEKSHFVSYCLCGLAFAIALLMPQYVHGQTATEIRESDLYYYGEGRGETTQQARDEALRALVSSISSHIVIKEEYNLAHHQTGEILSDSLNFRHTFKSYSSATLTGAKMLEIDPAPNAHVLLWIKKAEVEKIFDTRKRRISEMVDAGIRAEDKGKVDVALRNLCWGLDLVKSLPIPSSFEYKGHTLVDWLVERIEDILSNIEVRVKNRKDDVCELYFTFRGKPVSSLDFYYYDGGFQSNLRSVRNGVGVMELSPGSVHGTYAIEVECNYREQTRLDPEIFSAAAVLPETSYKAAHREVQVNPSPAPIEELAGKHDLSFTEIPDSLFERPALMSDDARYQQAMATVMDAVRSKKPALARNLFTSYGLEVYQKLITYGNARVLGQPHFSFMNNGDEVSGRGAQMEFRYRNNHRQFVEDLTFTFNAEGLIDNIAFGLGTTTEDDILGNKEYPEQIRKILVQFLENYQTAYALKRIDYIESIFDEDAIIIVGKLLKQRGRINPETGRMTFNKNDFQYVRHNKSSYMENLRKAFASNEFINLRLNNCTVRKSAKGGEIYGVQIEQDYYSTHYSDHGYLFLEINLNDVSHPLILIRTWQPEPDPEFGLYGLDHFKISD